MKPNAQDEKIADKIVLDHFIDEQNGTDGSMARLEKVIAEALQKARADERERCAKIAIEALVYCMDGCSCDGIERCRYCEKANDTIEAIRNLK